MGNMVRLSHQEVTKQSLEHKCVPKQELGNEPFMFQGKTQNHEIVGCVSRTIFGA